MLPTVTNVCPASPGFRILQSLQGHVSVFVSMRPEYFTHLLQVRGHIHVAVDWLGIVPPTQPELFFFYDPTPIFRQLRLKRRFGGLIKHIFPLTYVIYWIFFFPSQRFVVFGGAPFQLQWSPDKRKKFKKGKHSTKEQKKSSTDA